MKAIKLPSAYTILLSIIVFVAVLTHLLPTGKYAYQNGEGKRLSPQEAMRGVEDGFLPLPNTYEAVESNPQGIFEVILAPIQGFYKAIDVSVFILMIGGFLGVIMATGAIDAGVKQVLKKLKGKEQWMIPVLTALFGLGGSTFGMAEETLAFYPVLIPVFASAGFNARTAVGTILLGAGFGVLSSTVNPFSTAIASGFAGISIGDGLGVRVFIWFVMWVLTSSFLLRYAKSVKTAPKIEEEQKEIALPALSQKQSLALILFALTFLVMIVGVIPFADLGITIMPTLGWWFNELNALFLCSAILMGVLVGMKEDEIASNFVNGARDMLGVAFIVGISRGITVVMNDGLIIDTILNYAEMAISGLSSSVFICMMFILEVFLSFFIPSTSGLATLTMPIMAPLSSFAGVEAHWVVTAYQTASGFVNLFTPTSAVVMGGLAIGKIGYGEFFKWVLPYLVVVFLLVLLVLGVGVMV
ncbi:hypothetical protein [Persicobacter diffluens]|uniref:C4-dicarboxylate ABC transporter n=1 Tax=Persicobacter diffluens TaxID=981 RepID=A0AAN4VVF8_9BACT|nr:C4-dicarboxylate ABC transporter [Persicobacter diffluens]